MHREARKKDASTREERKLILDKRRRARDIEYKEGDRVLIKQKKTTTEPPFDPKPYTITKVEGIQVTAERGDKTRVRNKAKWKLVKERPRRLQPRPRDSQDGDSDSDDDWYTGPASQQQEAAQDDHEEEEGVEEGDEGTQEPEGDVTFSPIASRTRRKAKGSVQLSPRERKRRKVQAMKRDKQNRMAGDREELRVNMKVKEKWLVRDKEGRMLEDQLPQSKVVTVRGLQEPGEGLE